MRFVAAIGLALFAPGAPSSAQDAAPSVKHYPAEAFAHLPLIQYPAISPDGTKIAAKMNVNGEQRLVIKTLDGSVPTAAVAAGDNDINWWNWVNDTWLVVGIGAESSVLGDKWYLSRAVGVRADGKKIQPLAFAGAAQDADDVLWVADDGTPRVLLSMQKSVFVEDEDFWQQVYEADVSTGKLKQVVRPHEGVLSWYADHSGTVRMGIGFDENARKASLLYRDDGKSNFHAVARADSRKDESLILPAMFLAEPGKALAFNDKDGSDAIYELDLATMTLGKKVFGVDGYDVDSLRADASGTVLAGISYTDDYSRVRWLDPKLEKIQAEFDKAIPDRRPRIISLNKDQTKMIVEVGSPNQTPAYYYFDTAVGALQLIASTNDDLKGVRLAPVKTIRYAARDGLQIPAILTLPRGREAKNLPLIVMPHGGPAARDEEGWDWLVQFIADRGYAVIQPNYRGSTGFGTEFLKKGDGEWGLKMQDDLNDAVTYLAEQGIADPKRVCMVGGSYGGYAAMRASQRDGDRYRCTVSYAGVSDLSHLARYDSRALYGARARDYLKKKAPDFKAVSPINFPEQFSTPILLVHGKMDRRVPVAQSREMAEKLEKAGKKFEYVEQSKADHFFSREEDRLQFLKLLEAFLAKHNPA